MLTNNRLYMKYCRIAVSLWRRRRREKFELKLWEQFSIIYWKMTNSTVNSDTLFPTLSFKRFNKLKLKKLLKLYALWMVISIKYICTYRIVRILSFPWSKVGFLQWLQCSCFTNENIFRMILRWIFMISRG